jgi:LCP family protein required for cell wall assembly
VLAGLAIVLVLGILAVHRAYDFGSAISTQAPFSTQTGYMSGVGRVNLLVMGYGGAGHDGANLTDSMMVISVVPHDGATTMISVPRDLWVQVPPGSGQYAKINTAYQDGLSNGFGGAAAGKLAAGAEAASKVSQVLGIDVSYWLTIDFSGFRQLIDSLGGVDVNVPTAFTARYPRNDDPAVDAGWKIIHFNTGPQHMNGEQAIEYARARYVLSPLSEGSDFARSARQQLLIHAILSRARQVSAWPGLTSATNALQGALYTNLSLADLALFAQKMDATHAARVGLSNQNVLVDAQTSDGQDILLPANGDWNAIQQYVASNMKS